MTTSDKHNAPLATTPHKTKSLLGLVIAWFKSLRHRFSLWMDYVEPTQNGAEDDTIKDDTPSVSEETTKEIKEKEAREDAETIEWVNQQESSLDTITALVLERIRLRARRRILWLRHLWHEASEGEQEHNYHTEVDAFLDNKDRPEAEYHWVNRKKKLGNLNESIADIEDTLTHHRQSRLSVLSQVFNLTDAESDLVQACFAISVEPNLSKVYAYLQDNQTRGYVTEELVARLYGHGYSLSLSTESPLKTWGLIQEKDMGKGEPTRLVCDPYIRNWLLDISNLDQSLVQGKIALSKSFGRVNHLEILLGQLNTEPPLVGWGVLSQINDYVEYGSSRTTNNLHLCMRWRLEVQPAQCAAAMAEADIGLGDAIDQSVLGELSLAPKTGKEAPIVAPSLRLDNVRASKWGFVKDHKVKITGTSKQTCRHADRQSPTYRQPKTMYCHGRDYSNGHNA